MRVAVVGGTGLVGRQVVEALRRAGHEAVPVSRSTGADVVTGEGLAAAFAGAGAVVDVTNTAARDAEATRAFFGAVSRNIGSAASGAGVGHHVVLSIVGLDRVEGNPHYAGKREQERVALEGPVPVTVVRATQFHDFAGMVASWSRDGDEVAMPPLLVQPVAVADLAAHLAEVATGGEPGGVREIAGPLTEDLVDMARRTLAARGETPRITPTWRGAFGVEMAGEVLLPGPDAYLAPTTFDAWLAAG